MKTFLVGSCGTGAAYQTIAALKNASSPTFIIGIDSSKSELNPSSVYVDKYIQVAELRSPKYLAEIERLYREEGITNFCGFFEKEIVLHRELCIVNGVKTVGAKDPEIFLDKPKYLSVLSSHGISVPHIFSNDELRQLRGDQAVIMKPIDGSGSNGVIVKNSIEKFDARKNMVMEYVDGDEYTIDCFRDAGLDNFYSLSRKRIEVKAGVCVKAEIQFNPALHEVAQEVARLLGIDGVFCIQVIRRAGKYYVIDVNSRPGAGTSMSKHAGIDFFELQAAYMQGAEYPVVPPQRTTSSVYVTRVYHDVCIRP